MKKLLFLAVGIIPAVSLFAQVGIGTNSPHPSAILELNATNKGFKGPSINLLNKNDVTTIPNPQKGLLVFNTANAGNFPDNVIANQYYYWNGSQWINVASNDQIEELLHPGIYVINDTSSQSFTSLNDASLKEVSFSLTPVLNSGGIVTKSGNRFIINRTGLYEVSSFVNYNPGKTTANQRALLNIIIQKSTDNGSTWTDVAGGRGAWGANTTNYYQTAIAPNTCIELKQNEYLRLVIQNPITTGSSSGHGSTTSIATSTNMPVSKSIRIQLLNY